VSIVVLKDRQIWSERRVKIVWWRINEATALMKVFTSEKHQEFKNPSAFHVR